MLKYCLTFIRQPGVKWTPDHLIGGVVCVLVKFNFSIFDIASRVISSTYVPYLGMKQKKRVSSERSNKNSLK